MKNITEKDLKNNLKLVSRKNPTQRTVVDVDGYKIGEKPVMIAGPCRVESLEQMEQIARFLRQNNVRFMRAGIYKPCTFPYADTGKGREGLQILQTIQRKYGLKMVTEIMHSSQLMYLDGIDIIQIGARNMQNYNLLADVAKTGKPILLKRHPGSSLRDFLGAAEWIMANGNEKVILCERGVAMPYTHDKDARWALDITVIPAAKKYTHLPIVIDPSHSAGTREFVPALSRAAIAAGADGLIVEIHPEPNKAQSDSLQHIDFNTFSELNSEVMVGLKLL